MTNNKCCNEEGCKKESMPFCRWCLIHCQEHWKDFGKHFPLQDSGDVK